MRQLTNVLLNPGIGILLPRLINLEPFSIQRVELVTRCASARGHVGHERAGIVRPLLTRAAGPLEGDVATRIGRNDHLGKSRVETTEEVLVTRALDWADVGDKADRARTCSGCFHIRWSCDSRSSSVRTLVIVGHVPFVRLSVYDNLADEAMGGNVWQSSGHHCKNRKALHALGEVVKCRAGRMYTRRRIVKMS